MSFSQIYSICNHANFTARTNATEFEQLLREEGIDPNSAEQINGTARMGWTLLEKAACKGNVAVMKYLLEYGAKMGNYPLICASTEGHIAAVQYLLEQGANTQNIIGDESRFVPIITALHGAVLYDRKEIIELLVGYGADVDKETVGGQTPYELAFKNGHEKLAEWIASKGNPLSLVWKAAMAISDEEADKVLKDNSLSNDYNLMEVIPRARRYKQLLLNKPS